MKFTKMEGLGNDYVYVDCTNYDLDNPSEVSKKISDRHFGIGSDGLILIKKSETCDFKMEMYNADGSQSEMCGNGIRCVGKFVYDKGLTDKTNITVETLAGIKTLWFEIKDEKVFMVTVDMGKPELLPEKIPVNYKGDSLINQNINVNNQDYKITCVSMGNPHAVTFVNDLDNLDINKIGPLFENHLMFPKRVNTEFVQVINKNYVKMRVFERGSGETFACGTGACAVLVACVLNNLTENECTVNLLGGDLFIKWEKELNKIFMTGPAKIVFEGEYTF